MTFTDRTELGRVADRGKANGYKLASPIEGLAASELFLKCGTAKNSIP
jgi:hypothetical protein